MWATDYGTSAEAKAMLEKAIVELEKDKVKALEMFNKGGSRFKNRELYPYCGGLDGNFTAHSTLVEKSLKDLKDKSGKPIGEEIYAKDKNSQFRKCVVCGLVPKRLSRSKKRPFYNGWRSSVRCWVLQINNQQLKC